MFSEFLNRQVKVVYADTRDGAPLNKVARGILTGIDEHFLHLDGMAIGLRFIVSVVPDSNGRPLP